MTDVPVLKITIDDSEFRAFQEQFAKFKTDADKMPEAWAATDAQIAIIKERFEQMHEAAAATGDGAERTATGTDKTAQGNKDVASTWGGMAITSRRFSVSVLQATRSLARWEKLTATFTGLIGLGGLYGLNTLAAGAAMRRQRASSIGVSTGEMASFQNAFGRLGNTDGIAEGFFGAETDARKTQPLASLGINPRGKDSLQVFAEAFPKIASIVDHADKKNFAASVAPYNLDQLGFDEQMLLRIREMGPEERQQLLGDYKANQSSVDIPDDVGRKWQEFDDQLRLAGLQIQTALAGDLVRLTPGLENLSKSAVKLFGALLAKPEIKTWLKRIDDGLEGFAGEIGSKDAKKNITEFLKRFEMTKQDFGVLNKWFAAHSGLIDGLAKAYVLYRSASLGYTIGNGIRIAAGVATSAGGLAVLGAGAATLPLILARKPELALGGSKAGDYNAGNELPGLNEINASEDKQRPATPASDYQVKPADGKPVPPLAVSNLFGRQPDVADVDPRLNEILAAAQTKLPDGYKMKVMEGYNPNGHAPGSQHHIKGKGALDIQIFGPDGKPIANSGDEDASGPYHRLARAAYGEMLARHPEMKDQFAWGGAFETSRGSGRADLMHYDFGGHRDRFRPENDMRTMGPLPEQLIPPKPKPGLVGLRAQSPNAQPKPPQTVTVHDETGGSTQIVAH